MQKRICNIKAFTVKVELLILGKKSKARGYLLLKIQKKRSAKEKIIRFEDAKQIATG